MMLGCCPPYTTARSRVALGRTQALFDQIKLAESDYPARIDAESRDLIAALLKPDEQERLGMFAMHH